MSLKKSLRVLITFIFLSSTNAYAQKIKVRKTKGNQAVVEFTGGNLVPGQVYELNDEMGLSTVSTESRKYFFDISAGFLTHKSDVAGSSSVTQVDLSSTLGWNFGIFEVGPSFSVSSTSTAGVTTSLYLAGLYADYNVIPNISGEAFTYGLSAHVLFGQVSVVERDLSILRLQPGVFTKWFVAGTNTGFRINVAYNYDRYLGDTAGTSATGITSSVGVINYF